MRVADERPNKISITMDNTGTQQTGMFRVGFGYQHANMWNRDHVLNAQYVTAPNDDDRTNRLGLYPSKHVLIVGAQYRIPLYEQGDTLDFSAGYSNVDSGVVGNLFNISGAGTIFAACATTRIWTRSGTWTTSSSYGYDWRAYQSIVTQIGVAGAGLVPDITVHPISLTYNGVYRKSESDTNFNLSVSQNLPGGNDAGTGAYLGRPLTSARRGRRRARARIRVISSMRWGFNHNRALPRDWQFRFGMNGQLTRDMLISGEQFGIGGADSVRGFLEREIIGDNGYRGTMEFYTPDFGSVVPYGGGQTARAGVLRLGRGEAHAPDRCWKSMASTSAASASACVSRAAPTSASGLDFARVIDAGGLQKSGDVRVHVSFAYIY